MSTASCQVSSRSGERTDTSNWKDGHPNKRKVQEKTTVEEAEENF